jgi:hypothetical protein
MTRAIRNTIAAVLAASTILGGANAAFADRYQRWLDVVNEGYGNVWSVQITEIDDGTWGPDLLGQYVIPAGYEMRVDPVDPDGYCRFDIRVVYESGHEVVVWDQNLCEMTTLFVSEGYGIIV